MFQFVENQVMKKGQSKVSNVILTNCVVPTQEEETDKMIRNLQISLRNVDVQDWHRVCLSASWLLLSVCVCVPSSPEKKKGRIESCTCNECIQNNAWQNLPFWSKSQIIPCLLPVIPLCPINTEILHRSILIIPSLSLQGGRTKHKHNTEG